MEDILNVKYSVDRKEEYQIKTIICEESNVKYVIKEAYSSKAIPHIQNIYNNYNLLSNLNMNIVECKLNGERIKFPFLEGENFAQILLTNIELKDRASLEENLIAYKKLLFQENLIEYKISHDFIEIFGFNNLEGHKSHIYSNIDLNFENIIFSCNNYHIIDYEWVYNFPIPLDYVMYRAITQFFNRYHSQISNFITLQEILGIWDISSEYLPIFDKMEENFIKNVAGGWFQQRKPYNKKIISRYDLIDRYYLDFYENKNNIQVFWSKNEIFTEEQSKIYSINKEDKLKLDIPGECVQKIRIDPSEKPFVICTISTTKGNGVDDFNLIKYLDSFTGVHIIKYEENLIECITLNSDPQLIFNHSPNSIIEIEIAFSEDSNKDKLELLSFVNLLINENSEKENKISQLSEEIEILDFKNNEYLNTLETIEQQTIYEKKILNEQLSRVSKINKEILNSKRWKLLSLFSKTKLNR